MEKLKRTTSLGGAIVLGLGSILGTGAYVSIALGAELAADWLLVCIVVAGATAIFNGLSSAQLAAVHPVSGGTYEYGYRFLSPIAGRIAGWLFVLAKSASAATAVMAVGWCLTAFFNLNDIANTVVVGGILLLLTVLILNGVSRTNRVNAALVFISVVGLLSFVLYGVSQYTADSASHMVTPHKTSFNGFFEATALLFVAYTGYGRIATMGEEVKRPRDTIPKAMVVTLAVSCLLYLGVGWAILIIDAQHPVVFSDDFQLSHLVHPKPLSLCIAVCGVMAMVGVVLNLVLGVSRVVLAMGRRGDLPRVFAVLNNRNTSAPMATMATAGLIFTITLFGDIKLTWSLSAFTVLVYYGITNWAALTIPAEQRFVPKWVSICGLISCLSLSVFVSFYVVITCLIVVGIGLAFSFYSK